MVPKLALAKAQSVVAPFFKQHAGAQSAHGESPTRGGTGILWKWWQSDYAPACKVGRRGLKSRPLLQTPRRLAMRQGDSDVLAGAIFAGAGAALIVGLLTSIGSSALTSMVTSSLAAQTAVGAFSALGIGYLAFTTVFRWVLDYFEGKPHD
jgi:hypothetical protein